MVLMQFVLLNQKQFNTLYRYNMAKITHSYLTFTSGLIENRIPYFKYEPKLYLKNNYKLY